MLETGVDHGNFRGVAVYVDGDEVVLVSELEAGWYRYVSRWRLHADGTIRARFGFGAVENSCVCERHHHHVYWRLDFDIGGAGSDVVLEHNDPPLPGHDSSWHILKHEIRRRRNAAHKRRWRVRNQDTNEGYILIPGSGDGEADSYGVGDFWALRYRSGQLDDSAVATGTRAHIDSFVNHESIVGTNVVVWYAAHFSHDVAHEDDATTTATSSGRRYARIAGSSGAGWNTTRSRPAAFAAYSARSARAISDSRLSADVDTAIPTLGVTDTTPPLPASTTLSARTRSLTRSADAVSGALVHIGDRDQELLAAVAHHDVARPHRAGDRGARRPQDVVADLVTVLVVDHLEVIEVEHHHADGRAAVRRDARHLHQPLEAGAAVEATGERVGGRLDLGRGVRERVAHREAERARQQGQQPAHLAVDVHAREEDRSERTRVAVERHDHDRRLVLEQLEL